MFFKSILENQRGATAMIYALLMLPIIALAAGALDFSARESAERKLKSATDIAAIAAVRHAIDLGLSPVTDQAKIKKAAKDAFVNNLGGLKSGGPLTPVVSVDEVTGVTVSAKFSYPTTMLGIVGINKLSVNAKSRAAYRGGSEIEAVLVLDNSYSMDGTRMDELRAAADEFLDTVMTAETDPDAVKIGIVPFNNYVNVGIANASETWIDVPANYVDSVGSCVVDDAASNAVGCSIIACTYSTDDPNCKQWSCPSGVDLVQSCTTSMVDHTWYGCAESRIPPLDIEDRDYDTSPERGRMNNDDWGCPVPILPLTSDRDAIEARLGEMFAEADTYIAPGLSWGVKVLSSKAPFTEGANEATFQNEGGRKILILMSDGENTRSRGEWGDPWGDHWSVDVDDANATTQKACEYAKSQKIDVYTVAFGVTDADTLKILQDCASSIDQFYKAMNATSLKNAFNAIGKNFNEIALVE